MTDTLKIALLSQTWGEADGFDIDQDGNFYAPEAIGLSDRIDPWGEADGFTKDADGNFCLPA